MPKNKFNIGDLVLNIAHGYTGFVVDYYYATNVLLIIEGRETTLPYTGYLYVLDRNVGKSKIFIGKDLYDREHQLIRIYDGDEFKAIEVSKEKTKELEKVND